MLAYDGVELFDLYPLWHGAFVFIGGVEVAGAGAGNKFRSLG